MGDPSWPEMRVRVKCSGCGEYGEGWTGFPTDVTTASRTLEFTPPNWTRRQGGYGAASTYTCEKCSRSESSLATVGGEFGS